MKIDNYINDVDTLRETVCEAITEFANNTGAMVKTVHIKMDIQRQDYSLPPLFTVVGVNFEFEG